MSKHAFQGKRPDTLVVDEDIEDKLSNFDPCDMFAVLYNRLRMDEQYALDSDDFESEREKSQDVSRFRSASRHILSALTLYNPIVLEVSIETSEKLERDLKQRQEDENLSPLEYFIKHNA